MARRTLLLAIAAVVTVHASEVVEALLSGAVDEPAGPDAAIFGIRPGLFGATHVDDTELTEPLLLRADASHTRAPDLIIYTQENRAVEVSLPSACGRIGWYVRVSALRGAFTAAHAAANLASGSNLPQYVGCTLVFTPEENFVGEQAFWFTEREREGVHVREIAHIRAGQVRTGVIVVAPARSAPVAIGDAFEVEQDGWAYLPVLANDEDADVSTHTHTPHACFRAGVEYHTAPTSAGQQHHSTAPTWLDVVVITDDARAHTSVHASVSGAPVLTSEAVPCVLLGPDAVGVPVSPLQRCVAHVTLPSLTSVMDIVVRLDEHVRGRVQSSTHELFRVSVNGTLFVRHVTGFRSEHGDEPGSEDATAGSTLFLRYGNISVASCDTLRVLSVSDPLHGHAMLMPSPDAPSFPCFGVPGAASIPEAVLRAAFEKAAAAGRLGPDGMPLVDARTLHDIGPACTGLWRSGSHVPSTVFMTMLDVLATVVLYYPDPGYTGSDSFTYDVGDGHPGLGPQSTATVNITVLRRSHGAEPSDGSPVIRSDAGPCVSPWRCIVQALDGRFNSLSRRDAGSMMTPLRRVSPTAYADGIDVPAGGDRPSTRLISNELFDQSHPIPSAQGFSELITHFGQLLTHDIDFSTPLADFKAEGNFVIPIPKCDPWFDADCTGTATMRFRRSGPQLGTGAGTDFPRQQLNKITSWCVKLAAPQRAHASIHVLAATCRLDLNIIYGTLNGRNRALRALTGGKLLHVPGYGETPDAAASHASSQPASKMQAGASPTAAGGYTDDEASGMNHTSSTGTRVTHAPLTAWGGAGRPHVQCFNTTVVGEDGRTLQHFVCKPRRSPLEHLALNANALPNLNLLGRARHTLFVSGDNRANVQPGLIAMHTLLAREHNTICDELQAALLAKYHSVDVTSLRSPYEPGRFGIVDANGTAQLEDTDGPPPPPPSRVTIDAEGRVSVQLLGAAAKDAGARQAIATSGGEIVEHVWHALHPHAAAFHTPAVPPLKNAVLEHIPGVTVRLEDATYPMPVAWPRPFDGSEAALRHYDNVLFQTARALTRAKWQAIVWYEYLPLILGPDEYGKIPAYSGYQGAGMIDPSASNEFATAAFRFGHSQVSSTMHRFNSEDACESQVGPLSLRDAYFTPTRLMAEGGVDPLIAGALLFPAEEVDTFAVSEVRNLLFGTNTQGFDLIALNIQRGRDHGLPDYNSVRTALGLSAVHSFADITPDIRIQQKLAELYRGNISNVDLTVGGLAEAHVPGGAVGPTFAALIRDTFTRIRDADRFWFEAAYMPCSFEAQAEERAGIPHLCTDTPQTEVLRKSAALEQLRGTRIADLLARNTDALDGVLGRELVWSALDPSETDTLIRRGAPRTRRARSSIPPTLSESLFLAREAARSSIRAACMGQPSDAPTTDGSGDSRDAAYGM